jgi:thiol:disulfide interchange protein
MHPLSRLICRTAVVYLAAGAVVGGLLLTAKALAIFPGLWRLRPVHIEWLAVGWMAQLAMGVAYWIFPRRGSPPREGWMRAAYALLNAGLALVTAGTLAEWNAFVPAGRLAEIGAALAFVYAVGPRVRSIEALAEARTRGKDG